MHGNKVAQDSGIYCMIRRSLMVIGTVRVAFVITILLLCAMIFVLPHFYELALYLDSRQGHKSLPNDSVVLALIGFACISVLFPMYWAAVFACCFREQIISRQELREELKQELREELKEIMKSSHSAPSKAGDRFGCKSRYGKE